jgi:tetratricopeptide (TPR) repeat protein
MRRRSKKKAPAVYSRAPVSPAGWSDRWAVRGVCIFLAAIIWAVFGQALGHEFVNYDDDVYVYENPEVVGGLTLHGIARAFIHVHAFNWHPLTWVSHMLDCQLYGLNPGGHHLTNILLHTVTAILLFLVMRRMTGALWRSAFVAMVFAIHPLRVESVAWVAERKDVLSGLFFMLTIGAYVRYVQKKAEVEGRKSRARAAPALNPRLWTLDYYLVLIFFALGLMCKPMLVTLPLVLLLLDFWPIQRFNDSTVSRLLVEKLPFFGLAVAAGVVAIFAQTGTIKTFEQISLPLRVGNALVSYVAYLGQMFWPSGLAVLYPLAARDIGISGVVLSLVLLAGISAGAFVLRRRPCLLTGWLWYLVMLVPVIGIIQVGSQARADRYTYLPQIGLYLSLTWAAADLCAGGRRRRVVLGGCAAIIVVALIFCARAQVAYWRNSESLWTHTLACTSDNFVGHNNLGNALLQKGSVNEAMAQYQKALQINPDYAEAHNNLSNALLQKGNVDEAITHLQKALQIDPDYAYAHNNLGNALIQKGSVNEAMAHYQKALQIKPDYLEVQNNLAWVLATCPQALLRNGNEAVKLARRANQLAGYGNPVVLGTLAAAYAEAGRFPEAVETAQRALQLAETQSNTALADALRSQIKLYQAGLPFHLY